MFETARLRLTAWYLLIIILISLLFSAMIYSMVNSEFTRFERMQISIEEKFRPFSPPRFVQIDRQAIAEARLRLIVTLGVINVGILVFAGGAGYFLAGRTLRPIKDMMDEQDRFVTDSSHELRTPLTALRSEIEVGLRDKNFTSQKGKQILKSNLEEVVSLQLLSDRLLELAQTGTYLHADNREEFSILVLVASAMRKTERLAHKKKIHIENAVKNIPITGVRDRLIEVFVILLDNAVKYASPNSTVTIASAKKGTSVTISVTNQGIGISEDDLPHIFERFYRAEKSRTEKGYGLGLSIAKKIVEAHNGSISVTSTPNKKTTFLVTLPL